MSKPNWKDAPEWAMWLAMDGGPNEFWVWFENEPELDGDCWLADRGKWHQTRCANNSTQPQDTLEQRPC